MKVAHLLWEVSCSLQMPLGFKFHLVLALVLPPCVTLCYPGAWFQSTPMGTKTPYIALTIGNFQYGVWQSYNPDDQVLAPQDAVWGGEGAGGRSGHQKASSKMYTRGL